ncbi:MAG: virulence RhuM family protein [Bacilli bacterium]|nr:virulence RhuM family protein [Bacilli bacterium]
MNIEEKSYELIKFEDGDFSLDVKVSPNEDTIWLNAQEIAMLFERDYKTILKHINNILKEELDYSVVAKFATTAKDGKTYNVDYYNLDMVISVGYRVKSKRGIIFRRWANSILKQYLLNGYAINKDRVIAYQSNILKLEASFINIENRLKNLEETVYADNDLTIFEGEILEPYTFLRKLFFLAKKQIIIIDNYADSFLLSMLSDIKVNIIIYTSNNSYLNNTRIKDNISIINTDLFHDRYLIIDDITYTMGTSFNSIGKKRFTITRLKDITADMLTKGIKKLSI